MSASADPLEASLSEESYRPEAGQIRWKIAAEAIIKGNSKDYEKQWNKKFRRQFKLMERLKKYFLKSDSAIEQMFSLHKRKQVQEASMRLWFEKDISLSSFLSYINFFKKFPN